jgi:uncharacterized membrane protein YbhN (UPF0104 family)
VKGTDEVLQDDGNSVPPARTWRKLIRPVLSLALAAFLLRYVLLHVFDTTASDVSHVFRQNVTVLNIVVLFCLWASGILVHSLTLTGALPGLTTRRAVTLNMTGSSVSNVIPFGGAFGMSLNYVMIRGWGMDATAFAAYTVVTNIWVVLIKLALPVLATAALFATGVTLSSGLALGVIASSVLLAGAVALVLTGLINPRVARIFKKYPDREKILAAVLDAREAVVTVFKQGWGQMAIGMLGWTVAQCALLWGCLHVVGLTISIPIVFAAYAIDRVATLIQLTPGASGFVEAGTAFVLVHLAGSYAGGTHETNVMIAAGALLYRAFSFALEIPVGGIWLSGWLLVRRSKRKAEMKEIGG